MSVIEQPLRRRSSSVNTIATTTTSSSSHTSQDKSASDSPPPRRHGECSEFFALTAALLMLPIFISGFFVSCRLNEPPPTFEVESLSVHPFNIYSSHITAYLVITFSIESPSIYSFEDVKVSVFYEDKNISSTMIRPFSSTTEERKLVQAHVGVASAYINDLVAEAMAEDWSNGAVTFTVNLTAVARNDRIAAARNSLLVEQRKPITVSCVNLEVVFPFDAKTAGTMWDAPRKCQLYR